MKKGSPAAVQDCLFEEGGTGFQPSLSSFSFWRTTSGVSVGTKLSMKW